jgi:hypothetical protein
MNKKPQQTYKDFYFIVIRTMQLNKSTHVDYFLLSEFGSTKEDQYELRERAWKKAERIVTALSEQDGVTYQLINVELISNAKYQAFCGYLNHYVDDTLRTHDTSDGKDEYEEESGDEA